MVRIPLPKALPLLLLTLAGPSGGQLELPGSPARSGAPGVPGRRGDLAPGSEPIGLDLPAGAVPEGQPTTPRTVPEGVPESDGARGLFDALERASSTSAVEGVLERLRALGPAALPEARARLEGARAAVLLAAGRTCLLLGTAEDRSRVADRLTRALPAEAGTALLDELARLDPVIVSPEFLVGLLDHPTGALRNAAHDALESRLSPALLGPLGAVLDGSRTASRLLALDLVARCTDPAGRNLVLSRLGDPSAEVAERAAGWLAADVEAQPVLLERAFDAGGPTERAQAYALLALVRREELSGEILLGPERVEALRRAMDSTTPAVAGASAIALARVGYRTPSVDREGWLDREVPHWLVRYGTGAVFHSDFSAFEGPCLRALALLSGQRFGTGEAARRWWAETATGFRARRGVIEVAPGAESTLRVELDAGAGRWALIGPLSDGSAAPRELFLDEVQAERLVRRLEALGVLGIGVPSTPPPGGDESFVEVRIGRDAKVFAFARGAEPSWFRALLEELGERVQSLRWQLFHEPGVTQRAAWLARREAFSDDRAPSERERALKDLVLELARRAPPAERVPYVAELERLLGRVGVVEGRDLVPCLALLEDQPVFDLQTARLVELARLAAGAAGREGDDPAGPSPARRVLERVLERYGSVAAEAAAALARDVEPAERRALCTDPRPVARAAAARALGSALDPAERALAIELLDDSDPSVLCGVLGPLRERPDERARDRLHALVGHADPDVRAAALEALGRLGGEGVHDLALLGLADPDPAVQLGGVRALAELRDPRSASLLASLLVRGPGSPLQAPARLGLLRMGEPGVLECLRLAGSSSPRTRREAGLFLAEALRPEAVRSLLTALTEDPADERVAFELAVLTGVDLRAAPRPAEAWWEWWDGVVHDDAWAWFQAAAERAGHRAPTDVPTGRAADLDPQLAAFLRGVVDSPHPALAERALRELEARLRIEPSGTGSEVRRAEVDAALEARR